MHEDEKIKPPREHEIRFKTLGKSYARAKKSVQHRGSDRRENRNGIANNRHKRLERLGPRLVVVILGTATLSAHKRMTEVAIVEERMHKSTRQIVMKIRHQGHDKSAADTQCVGVTAAVYPLRRLLFVHNSSFKNRNPLQAR